MTGGAGRFSSSLTAQVLALVFGAVVAAQAVTILAVFLLPPGAPPVYTMAQVAAALNGKALANDQGRRLTRTVATSPPAELVDDPFAAPAGAQVGAILGAPEGRVLLHRRRPPPFVMATAGDRLFGPPQPPRRPPEAGPGAPFGPFGPDGPDGPRGPFGPRFGPPGETPPVRGEFVAGLRLADGRWAIVQPQPELEWLRRIAIWVGGGLLIMGPVGYWFAQRISAPLKGFAASAEILGRDPQAAPMAPSGPAEIGAAARAFNAMQGRIQRYVSDRVSMIGAISHDLRTPLTRIRFKIEPADPQVRAAVLSDVAQMEHMIDAVIAFAQDDAAPNVRQRLDLTSLVVAVADEAVATGADVVARFGPLAIVDGDPVALQRLFVNLVDNAVKYGERARVSVRVRGGEAVVEVADDGPGLPPEELERAFAPFYRTAPAQAGPAAGVGLGLSTARSIARAHGGEVALRSTGQGVVAEVVLPLARTVDPGAAGRDASR